MKKTSVIAAAFAAVVAGPALAADLPVKEPQVYRTPLVSLTNNWTGLYVGGNVGYGWAHNDPGIISFYDSTGVLAGTIPGIRANLQGVIAGGQAGYNYQFSNVVLGVEGDISWTGIKRSVADTVNNYKATAQIDWLATGRGRAGLAFDRTLVYATGGVAAGSVKITLDDSYASVIRTISTTTHIGWTAGAGVETAISPNLSLRAEYLYVDLGSKQNNHYEPAPGWPQISYRSAVNANIVRIGLNYIFGSAPY